MALARTVDALELSVVMPVYNEERSIAAVLARVLALPLALEVVVVDDGSRDGSVRAVRALADSRVRLIAHARNRGKGAALRTGIAAARGVVVAVQDADLEYSPADLLPMVRMVLEGEADAVFGSRFLRDNQWLSTSRVANRALTALTNVLFGSRLTDMETCYKVVRRETLAGLELRSERFDIEPEITASLLSRGVAIREVPIGYQARTVREGKKIRARDGVHAVKTLLRCWLEQRLRSPRA